MSSKNRIDFEVFQLGTGNAFFDILNEVPANLNSHNLKTFFEESLNLFQRADVSHATKCQLMSALIRALSSQGNIEQFIEWELVEKLPFKLFFLQEKLLNLIYVFAKYAPHGINKKASNYFGHLIGRYPRKCLTILSVFAERFEIVLDPWPMLDNLYRYCDYFRAPELVDDYLSVLLYLCSTFVDYREGRQQHTWYALCQVIEKCEVTSVKISAYYGLCNLYEFRPKIIGTYPFPVSAPQHLRNPQLQHAVLSLLFRVPPNGVVEPVIKALLEIRNEMSCQVLVKLAENRICAQHLASDLSWLKFDLPSQNGTIILFAKLLSFIPVRRALISRSEIGPFFNRIVELKNKSALITVSTFVRRLPVTQRYVSFILCKSGFLGNFFKAALQSDDKAVVCSTLLMIDQIARNCDAPEFAEICEFVSEHVRDQNGAACKASVSLARHSRCAVLFKQEGLDTYYQEHQDNDFSKQFLANFQKGIRGQPLSQPSTPKSKPTPKPEPVKKQSCSSSSSSEEPPKQPEPKPQPQPVKKSKSSSSSSESEHEPKPEPVKKTSSSESESEHEPKPEPQPEPIKKSSSSESEHEPQPEPVKKSSSSESEHEPQPEPVKKTSSSSSESEHEPKPEPQPEPVKKTSSSESEHEPEPEQKSDSEPEPKKESSSSDSEVVVSKLDVDEDDDKSDSSSSSSKKDKSSSSDNEQSRIAPSGSSGRIPSVLPRPDQTNTLLPGTLPGHLAGGALATPPTPTPRRKGRE